MMRYTRTQYRPASRQVNDHGRVSGTHTLPVPTRPVSRRSVDQFRQAAERARAGCAQFPLGGAAVHVGIVERCGVCPRGPGCVAQPSEHPVGCRASRGSGRVVAGSWPRSRSRNAAVKAASASGMYSSIRSAASRIPSDADSNSRTLSSTGVDGRIACSRSPIADSKAVNSGGSAINDHGSGSCGPGAGSDAAMTGIVAPSPVLPR